jgi:putative tryptophan/tyrosine transport system substrate-binding protein
LLELLPQARHIAALADPNFAEWRVASIVGSGHRPRRAAFDLSCGRESQEITPATERARTEGVQALNVLASSLFNAFHSEILALVASSSMLAIYLWPEWVKEGGLIAYGPGFAAIYRQCALQLIIN